MHAIHYKNVVAEYQIVFQELNLFLIYSEHKTQYLLGLLGRIGILLLIPPE